jgi:hypothetical protein
VALRPIGWMALAAAELTLPGHVVRAETLALLARRAGVAADLAPARAAVEPAAEEAWGTDAFLAALTLTERCAGGETAPDPLIWKARLPVATGSKALGGVLRRERITVSVAEVEARERLSSVPGAHRNARGALPLTVGFGVALPLTDAADARVQRRTVSVALTELVRPHGVCREAAAPHAIAGIPARLALVAAASEGDVAGGASGRHASAGAEVCRGDGPRRVERDALQLGPALVAVEPAPALAALRCRAAQPRCTVGGRATKLSLDAREHLSDAIRAATGRRALEPSATSAKPCTRALRRYDVAVCRTIAGAGERFAPARHPDATSPLPAAILGDATVLLADAADARV